MRIILLLLILWTNSASAVDKQYTNAINQQNWEIAKKNTDKDLRSLTFWLKLITEKQPNFYELTSFINQHPNWPKQETLITEAEKSLLNNVKNADILTWFKDHPPQTTEAKLKYLACIEDKKFKAEYAKQVWHQASFTKLQEINFLNKYRSLLSSDDHIKRIDYLLYNRNIEQATRILAYLPDSKRKIYNLRLGLIQGKIDAAKVTLDHKTDIGLLHDLAYKHDKNDDEDDLIDTLTIASSVKHDAQVYLWKLKAKLIRALVQRKDYKAAYSFASTHSNNDIKEYSEAEWLSGWIALRFLNSPKSAINHFSNFYNKVKMPISLSRGAYWLGRSYEKLGDKEKSVYWYKIAAKYYTSFYGQLASCKVNNCQAELPKEYKFTAAEIQKYGNNSLVKAATALQGSNYNYLDKVLLFKAIENSSDPREIAYISKIGYGNGHHFSAELAKQASYKNVIVMEASYPMPKFIYAKQGIDKALVLSLIRQESVFNHKAVSTAGAMGLMQIMPHVAKQTAKNINIKYHQAKLTQDPLFNTRLGVSHLDELLNKYNNSYILSIAAYNAGGKPVSAWIEDNGDPRLMRSEEDIVDWLEKITYHETRNYVQRVLENRAIYHAMINKKNKILIRF